MAEMKFDLYRVDNLNVATKVWDAVHVAGTVPPGSFLYNTYKDLLYIVDENGLAQVINFDTLYPVGSIYTTISDSDPAFIDGDAGRGGSFTPGTGTWQKLDDFISLVDESGNETELHMWKRTN